MDSRFFITLPLAASLTVAIAFGSIDDLRMASISPVGLIVLSVVSALLFITIYQQFPGRTVQTSPQGKTNPLTAIELIVVTVAAVYALIAATGGLHAVTHPIIYAVIAFSATFLGTLPTSIALVQALAIEAYWFHTAPASANPGTAFALHAVFLVGALGLHALFFRGFLAARRNEQAKALKAEIQHYRESARDYRLISTALGGDSREPLPRQQEQHLLAAGGVQAIHASILAQLSMLKAALGARTCVLLWRTNDNRLKIKELVSDSDAIREDEWIPVQGPLAVSLRDAQTLEVNATKSGQLPYYNSRSITGSLLSAPVLEGQHVRGVLCCDADTKMPAFATRLVQTASAEIVRAIQTESVIANVERSRYEHERFYCASSTLGEALTVDEVVRNAYEAAAQIVDYDIAAISIYDNDCQRHRVHSTRLAAGAEDMTAKDAWDGLEFRPNTGLASMVVKNRHYLPVGGEARDSATNVFTYKTKLRHAESLLVLPLLIADEAIGTLCLASKKPGRFHKDIRAMLGVIAKQVAVSLQNAIMYRKMETMATTDGLTQLTNHRTFQARFADLLSRAERQSTPLALLLCDVDHFKKVNDNYGHPVGDEVLRRVAQVLRKAVRKVDIPARYGGEEFAVVLDATDLDGALQTAERIREDVEAMAIESEKGPFRVTMSLGVAMFPEDGTERAHLIEHADLALYRAKESGRNQVMSYQEFAAQRRRAS